MTLPLRELARNYKCFGTPASATTILLREQARSDQCFGSPADELKIHLFLIHFSV